MPPRMIPDIPLSDIVDLYERTVYEALRSQLPKEWVVRYNFDFVAMGYQHLFDGQSDFLSLIHISEPPRGFPIRLIRLRETSTTSWKKSFAGN